jgi:hypothetical protein
MSNYDQFSEKKVVPKFFSYKVEVMDYKEEYGERMQKEGRDYLRHGENGEEIWGSVKGHTIWSCDGKPCTDILLRLGHTKGVPCLGMNYLENIEEDPIWGDKYRSWDLPAIIFHGVQEMFLTNRDWTEDGIRGVFRPTSWDISNYMTYNKVPTRMIEWVKNKKGEEIPLIKEEYIPFIRTRIKENMAGAFKANLAKDWIEGRVPKKHIKGKWYSGKECWDKFNFCEGTFILPGTVNVEGGTIKIAWSVYKNKEEGNASYFYRLWWGNGKSFTPLNDEFYEGL